MKKRKDPDQSQREQNPPYPPLQAARLRSLCAPVGSCPWMTPDLSPSSHGEDPKPAMLDFGSRLAAAQIKRADPRTRRAGREGPTQKSSHINEFDYKIQTPTSDVNTFVD